MRALGALLAAVALGVAVVIALLVQDDQVAEAPPASTPDVVEASRETSQPDEGADRSAMAAPQTEIVPDVRQVIPGTEAVPQPGDVIERLPAPPVPVQPPRPVNLGIVIVESANRLDTRRGMITLAGTRSVDPERICPMADGREPQCTILARTAVRRFVGQRRVDCVLGSRDDTAVDHQAPCTLGEVDLALWVVQQGWAYAAENASDALSTAEAEARDAGRGLWGLTSR